MGNEEGRTHDKELELLRELIRLLPLLQQKREASRSVLELLTRSKQLGRVLLQTRMPDFLNHASALEGREPCGESGCGACLAFYAEGEGAE